MVKKITIITLSLLSIISCSKKLNSQNINTKDNEVKNQISEIPENAKYAYFSSGCFWGTEYWFEKSKGVFSVVSGYAGGHKANPTYQEVCTGLTGHLETVKVGYDPEKTTYEELVKLFFETHDFTQKNGQGPDIGSQYLSAIFYQTPEEKEAEDYHQNYYAKKGAMPYCHFYTKLF